jgi:hypothetical protein
MAKKKSPQLPKWKKQRNTRLKFYNKTVKITRKELAKAGLDLNYNAARKFTSQFVFSKYKGLPTSKIKAAEIRELAQKAIEENLKAVPPPPKIEFVDPRAISETEVEGINWWDIDDFLKGAGSPNMFDARALRGSNFGKNLRFEVISSPTERTGELTILEYDGVMDGVMDIIESIREATENKSGPYFSGTVGKRAGRTDLNDPDTYILQFILYVNDQPVIPPDEAITLLPQRSMTPEEYEEYKKKLADKIARKDEIAQRQEEIAKAKARKTAKRPTKKKKVKEPEPTPEPVKPIKKTRGDRVLELNEQKIKELEMLRKDLDDKIITKKEYKADRERIMKQYEEALKKLKRGGIV